MSSRKIRWLMWSGSLGAAVLFAGDMLFYGEWGSARSWSHDYFLSRMANVALWRHHLGSITGPVGMGPDLLGMLGIWFCCRRAAPRLAVVMLACLYSNDLSGILQHGIFGPLGFAIRYCGAKSDAVAQILKLNETLGTGQMVLGSVGLLIWIFLVLGNKAGVPRWTVLFCPLLTYWLEYAVVYVPAPLGLPLWGGWSNVVEAMWFTVLALTYGHREFDNRVAEAAESGPADFLIAKRKA
jgi:hypothetical protein